MESKLNHTSIEAYSTAYAKKVTSDYYKDHDIISGKDIVTLCNIKQINFFALKILFQKWKKETEKLQSPYFDYSDKEVAEALRTFMNVLSQKIVVKRQHFEPILKKAVQETILLIFSPFDYYIKEINNPERSRVSLEELREISNYVKINSQHLDRLMERIKKKGVKEVFNDEGAELLAEVFEDTKDELQENYSAYIEQFSETLPLSMDMVFEEAVPENVDEDFGLLKGKAPEPEENSSNSNFFNEQLTLNEKLNTGVQPSLADLHARKKIDNIKKHISIYQRFMFINELFEGKAEEFEEALESFEKCNNYNEALDIISSTYINRYHWDIDAEEVNEFLEILYKRYN